MAVVCVLLLHCPSHLRFVPPPRRNKDVIVYSAEEVTVLLERDSSSGNVKRPESLCEITAYFHIVFLPGCQRSDHWHDPIQIKLREG